MKEIEGGAAGKAVRTLKQNGKFAEGEQIPQKLQDLFPNSEMEAMEIDSSHIEDLSHSQVNEELIQKIGEEIEKLP